MALMYGLDLEDCSGYARCQEFGKRWDSVQDQNRETLNNLKGLFMDQQRYTTIEEQVDYAVSKIPETQTVTMSARDLIFVFQTLGELVRFFHQPLHYQSLEDVERFLGSVNEGAFRLISECYYKRLRDVWPKEIATALDNGEMDHPDSPYYCGAAPGQQK